MVIVKIHIPIFTNFGCTTCMLNNGVIRSIDIDLSKLNGEKTNRLWIWLYLNSGFKFASLIIILLLFFYWTVDPNKLQLIVWFCNSHLYYRVIFLCIVWRKKFGNIGIQSRKYLDHPNDVYRFILFFFFFDNEIVYINHSLNFNYTYSLCLSSFIDT